MSDAWKKPKGYRCGRCLATAAASAAPVERHCIADFPCRADIFVYAGLHRACFACAPHMDELRKLEGWEPCGRFWTSTHIEDFQQYEIRRRIDAANSEAAHG